MRVLVTGAAGFIGSHVACALVARGHDVWGVDAFRTDNPRANKEVNLALAQGAGAWPCDEREVGSLTVAEMVGTDVVVHLAGQAGIRESWDEFDSHLYDNLSETNSLARLMAVADVSRLVFASSSSIYGEADVLPLREDSPAHPRSPYGVTKLAGESLLEAHALATPFDVVALRLFTVYGPGQREGMAIARLIDAALAGNDFPMNGDGSQVRDFIYIDDVVRAIVASVESDIPAGFTALNIGATDQVSLSDLLRLVEQESGVEIRVRVLSPQVGDVMRTVADSQRAREVLGWEPAVSLRDGVARQIAFARNPNFTAWAGERP